MTDEQRTKLKGMSDQARESLLQTINLEASRSKIEPHFVQDFRYACLHHDIFISPELTESRLMDGINHVKFAHSVIHHTINNLLKPPSVSSEQLTHGESRELKARRDKLKNWLAKRERLALKKSSPGFDMDEARRRNEKYIAEVSDDIERLENEQKS